MTDSGVLASTDDTNHTTSIANTISPHFVSVRDYTTIVDGVISNQAEIQQALNVAIAINAALLWPAGTYVSTENLIGFHSIRHIGDGTLKRGAATFKFAQRDTLLNELYVSLTGADTNDGLTPNLPIKTLQAMMDIMQGPSILPRLGSGHWKVNIGAGTYTEGGSWAAQATAKEYVTFAGEVDANNVPTTIIDGTSSKKTAGLYFEGPSRLIVENIASNNFRSNSVASGFVFANKGIQKAWVKNIRATNNLWAGLNVDNIGQILTTGGDLSSNTHYNLRVRGGVALSIGQGGAAPNGRLRLSDCATSVQIRDCCAGHFDYVDIEDCATGVWITNVSRTVLNNCTLTNVKVGVRAGNGATFTYVDTAFANVPTKFITEQNASHDTSSTANTEGGDGLGFDSFHNRYSIGVKQWGGPSPSGAPAYIFATNKTGVATYSYLVPNATDMQVLVGNTNNTALFRTIHSFAGAQFRFQYDGTQALYVSTSSTTSGRDNLSSLGTSGARWSTAFFGTAPTVSSDERLKQQIKPIDHHCLSAWAKVEYMQYKFNDAVESKGSGARWHFGLIAQRVKEAFESEGLDAFEYGLLCYDSWDAQEQAFDKDGAVIQDPVNAGDRFGIRYEEALALECAYLRSLITKQN